MLQTGLHEVFDAFSAFGCHGVQSSGLEGKQWAKLCWAKLWALKESGMLDKNFTATDCDLIFTRVKAKGAKKITFEQFERALEPVADKKVGAGAVITEVTAQLIKAGGPKSSGTEAESVRFFDDKSSCTGVYAHGGPTNVDGNKDLKSICDRSSADMRGVSKTYAKQN